MEAAVQSFTNAPIYNVEPFSITGPRAQKERIKQAEKVLTVVAGGESEVKNLCRGILQEPDFVGSVKNAFTKLADNVTTHTHTPHHTENAPKANTHRTRTHGRLIPIMMFFCSCALPNTGNGPDMKKSVTRCTAEILTLC